MLSRLIAKPSNLRFITLLSSQINRYNTLSSPPLHSLRSAYSLTGSPEFAFTLNFSFENARCFSSKSGDGKDEAQSKLWKSSSGNEDKGESVFGENGDDLAGLNESFDVAGVGSRTVEDNSWSKGFTERGDTGDDVFRGIDRDPGIKNGADDNEWLTADGYKPWSFGDEVKADHIFDIGEERSEEEKQVYLEEQRNTEEEKQLEEEEQALLPVVKGKLEFFFFFYLLIFSICCNSSFIILEKFLAHSTRVLVTWKAISIFCGNLLHSLEVFFCLLKVTLLLFKLCSFIASSSSPFLLLVLLLLME